MFRSIVSPALALAGVLLLAACATTSPAINPFSGRQLRAIQVGIDSVLFSPAFSDAYWSVHVVDLESRTTIYSRNASKNLVPASNVKLYTTAAALEHLGPDYTYETILYSTGIVRGDTLVGDLIIRGSGDPTISGRYLDDPLDPLRAWADSLSRHGVRVVAGDIIADDRFFTDPLLGSGWMWDDEDSYDSAQISALSILDNCVRLTIKPTAVGETANVTWKPLSTSYVNVINGSRTVEPDTGGVNRVTRRRGTNDLLVLSSIPLDTAYTDRPITIHDPAGYFAHVFKDVLSDRGFEVLGNSRTVRSVLRLPDYAAHDLWRVASHKSPPLFVIVREVNKDSENLDAELLLRTIGAARAQEKPSSRGETTIALHSVKETLARAGADTMGITLVDGSGLSRYDLVTASATTQLLTYMSKHDDQAVRDAFLSSLPVGGVDGTLRRRYRAPSRARGRVMAKTGTMTAISSLSGYVITDSSRQLVFSIMSNNYSVPTDSVRAAQDAIVSRLTGL